MASARNIEEMDVEWPRHKGQGIRPVQGAHVLLYEGTRHFRLYEPGAAPAAPTGPALRRRV
ncbi:hypothetical protein ACH4SK_44125 [Streptomyces inhibens]|uniref:hypothetical protein n=1 Tax=Streptomyces inhibens TaxID=2293571 RepID=UPI0037B51EFD